MSIPRFDGQTVVITGVGRAGQVGEMVASRLASLGATLVLLDRSDEVHARAAAVVAAGGTATGFVCDLTDPNATRATAARVATLAPAGIVGLVCLAGGFGVTGPVGESDPDAWHLQIAINLTTAYLTVRAFAPLVRQAAGAIVFFSSAAALPGGRVAESAAYAAAKSGVLALMHAVVQEERPYGVRANALAPTAIRTASNMASMDGDAKFVERETVADWVALLCAPGMSVNDQVIKLG